MTTSPVSPATVATVHAGGAVDPARGKAARPLPDVDLLGLQDQLSSAERRRFARIQEHLQTVVRPGTVDAWNEERFTQELLPGLGELGLGEMVCTDASPLFQNLVHAEIARVDLSLSALVGIHNELIVGAIRELGSEQQRQRWLPGLRRLEQVGAFCLTEPDHGSDVAGGLATTATREGEEWVINGAKRWIGAGTIAAVAVLWARDTADGQIKGFLVPTDTPGYTATKISGKTGLRIMQNADIEFRDLRLPADALMPGATGFDTTRALLRDSRAWVGWQAVGAQQGVLDVLRSYALQREQFGRPLAGFQVIQTMLAEIAGNMAASAGLMMQVLRLQEAGELEPFHAAMAKSTCTRLARASVAMGRDAMGGNGIVSHYEMAKIQGDLEAIYTYEGTYHVNSLIVGRALTGVSAFT